MVQVLSGKGVKVWFRNTAATTTEPGLNFPSPRAAVTMVDGVGTTLAVGDLLGWDATNNYWAETALADEAFMVVTSIDTTLNKVEATLLV
jgi:hypothetical protein